MGEFEVDVERDVPIEASDGVALLADIYHPVGADRCPTILERTPYGRAMFADAAMNAARHGYHVVSQDCRGSGGSAGTPSFFDEAGDGRSAGDWIARQSWFNGQLAACGGSYLGFTACAVAATRPPYLAALCVSLFGMERRRSWYPGGSFALDIALPWSQVRVATRDGLFEAADLEQITKAMAKMNAALDRALVHLPLCEADQVAVGETLPWYQEWLQHDAPDDPYWSALDYSNVIPGLGVPVLLTDGWYDYQLPYLLEDHHRMVASGHPTRLVIGPWAHPTVDGTVAQDEMLAFLDAHLKDDRTRLRPHRARVFVMPDSGWREYHEWPPPTLPQHWYLQENGGLAQSLPGDADPDRYIYDPADPTPSAGGASLRPPPHSGPVDNRELEARADVLTYTSPALDEDLEALGAVTTDLYVTSSSQFTDFFVRVCDVHPDGRSINVCDGLRRLQPSDPAAGDDGVRRVPIALWDTAYRFAAGHRIRVQVSSGAHPRYARNLGSGEPLATATTIVVQHQAIHHDSRHPSALTLNVSTGEGGD